ncbi:MAG: RsmB/NOP family class I SAM-dependent RNA methyltransferase [Spirochaetia bacterium]
MSRSPHGADAFHQYYEELFSDRWSVLRPALLSESVYATLSDCLTKPYYLDPASAVVALALDVRPGHDVLDLCAAPGGKSLVLACGLNGNGRLVANERSATRRGRLHRVLDGHLTDRARSAVIVTGHDASRWALHEPESYDRVLADVPCSSERHVMQSARDLAQWSPSRTRRLAQAAYAIGCAAVDAARPGGLIAYSTCALSPLENDGVVKRLLNRSRQRLRSVPPPSAEPSASEPALLREVPFDWEPTEFGQTVLPDRNNGAGPMYFALLQK